MGLWSDAFSIGPADARKIPCGPANHRIHRDQHGGASEASSTLGPAEEGSPYEGAYSGGGAGVAAAVNRPSMIGTATLIISV